MSSSTAAPAVRADSVALAPEAVAAPGRVRAYAVAAAIIAGVLAAVLWSATLVDESIGFNVTNGVLGSGTTAKPISSSGMGIVFALVSGLAGSFTACNVAGLCAIAPLSASRRTFSDTLRPLGWLALGACSVSGLYGAIGALAGTGIPQLSTSLIGGNFPVRLVQSMVVFGVIGLAMLGMGLAAAGIVPDPLARLRARIPQVQLLVVGGLIGAFLIGRPYPLFFKLFTKAASTHDPAYGALLFILQSLGNIAVMSLVFVAASSAFGGRFPRWLTARPTRAATFTAVAFAAAGAFLISYWCIRLPAQFGIGWWPTMPWK